MNGCVLDDLQCRGRNRHPCCQSELCLWWNSGSHCRYKTITDDITLGAKHIHSWLQFSGMLYSWRLWVSAVTDYILVCCSGGKTALTQFHSPTYKCWWIDHDRRILSPEELQKYQPCHSRSARGSCLEGLTSWVHHNDCLQRRAGKRCRTLRPQRHLHDWTHSRRTPQHNPSDDI